MNKRIVLIRPFFKGHFLNYFQLFLNSCKNNPEFDWMVFTDNEDEYDYPANVHKIRMTFEEAKALIQSKFDFPISIPEPYKLCDYKASFGYVFSDYIKEYDFWGHTDYDVIYGDLSRFVTDEMLDSYDKLFVMGHFALYKNTSEITTLFMKEIQGKFPYKEAMISEDNCNFDEDWGRSLNINDIFRDQGKRLYENPENESFIADIYDKSCRFRVTYYDRKVFQDMKEKKKNAFFAYRNGRLLRYEKVNGSVKETEYMYIHLLHRNMQLGEGVLDHHNFTVIPDIFQPLYTEVNEQTYDSIQKSQFNLNYFRLRWSNFKTKMKKLKRQMGLSGRLPGG